MLKISSLFKFYKPLSAENRKLTVTNRPEKLVFGRVGKYVMATYSAAIQKNELEKVDEDFKGMEAMLKKPKIKDFFKTNNIKANVKADMLISAGKEAGLASCTLNLLAVLAENNRLILLEKIVEVFRQVMRTYRNEVICEVITAKPLEGDAKSKLDATLLDIVKDKKIIVIHKVIPKILGGIILNIEDKHIDLSILRKVLLYKKLLTDPL